MNYLGRSGKIQLEDVARRLKERGIEVETPIIVGKSPILVETPEEATEKIIEFIGTSKDVIVTRDPRRGDILLVMTKDKCLVLVEKEKKPQ